VFTEIEAGILDDFGDMFFRHTEEKMTSQTSPQHKNAGSARKSDEGTEPVEQLIRQLVSLLCKQKAPLEPRHGVIPEEIVLDRIVDAVRYLLIRMPPATADHAPLSPREHEIVRMVAAGHPTKVIAGVLNISCWTVTAHLRRIFMKLGVTSRPAMVARLLKESRSWDVRMQAQKPLVDTKASFDASAEPDSRGNGSRSFVRA